MPDPTNLQTRTCTRADLRQLRPLMEAERESVGFIPWPAFEQRARRGDVIVASDDYGLLGYALVYCPSRRPAAPLQLHQVIVRQTARRAGVGRMLVATAAALANTQGRQIVQAWCRVDLEASCFWRALDFDAVAIRPGGKKRRSALILWRTALSDATRQNGVYWTLPSRAGAASKLDTQMRHLDATEACQIFAAKPDQLEQVLRSLRCDRPGKSVRSRS
jgi:L-amino acid N-acyltransferase YncA